MSLLLLCVLYTTRLRCLMFSSAYPHGLTLGCSESHCLGKIWEEFAEIYGEMHKILAAMGVHREVAPSRRKENCRSQHSQVSQNRSFLKFGQGFYAVLSSSASEPMPAVPTCTGIARENVSSTVTSSPLTFWDFIIALGNAAHFFSYDWV